MSLTYGIDVSRHQGRIDWQKVAQPGSILCPSGIRASCQYAFVKVSEGDDGTYSTARENVEGVLRTRIMLGAYHFARMDTGGTLDPINEAHAFLDGIENSGAQAAKLLVIDLEKLGEVKDHLTRDEARIWLWAWLGYVDAHTAPQLLIYGRNLPDWLGDDGLAVYPLWVPRYGKQDGRNAGDPGELPKPWKQWYIHQYTSKGQVDGIAGDVDLDVMRPVDFSRLAHARRAVPILAPLVGDLVGL